MNPKETILPDGRDSMTITEIVNRCVDTAEILRRHVRESDWNGVLSSANFLDATAKRIETHGVTIQSESEPLCKCDHEADLHGSEGCIGLITPDVHCPCETFDATVQAFASLPERRGNPHEYGNEELADYIESLAVPFSNPFPAAALKEAADRLRSGEIV